MERPLSYFDDFWQNALNSSNSARGIPRPESEVIRVEVNETTTIRLGKLLGLLPTSVDGNVASSNFLAHEVAAFLAVIDFNERSSRFSDSLKELNCNLYLTIDFLDSMFSPIVAGKQWQDTFLFSNEQNQIQPRPMAVVGPARSAVSDIVSTLGGVVELPSGSGGIPNISPSATSTRLDNNDQYPLFGRTIPTNNGEAVALCIYLQSINVRQLAILYVNDNYGIDFLLGVQNAASQFGISIFSVSYTDGLDEQLDSAISQLKTSDYNYFFGIFSVGTVDTTVLRLYGEGLLNRTDTVWLFGETANELFDRQLSTTNQTNVDLAQALNGTGTVLLNTPKREQGIFEQLLQDFQENEALVEYYLSKHLSGPLTDRTVSMFRSTDFTPTPSIYSMMAYDAVMALGIGACEIESDFFSGPTLFEAFKKVEFGGATGGVAFNNITGTRNEEDLTYQIYNLIAVPDEAGEFVTISATKTQLITLQNASIEVLRPFVFFGGSTTPPQAQHVPTENLNLVSDGVRSVCWALSGALVVLSVYCAVWTIMRRKTPVVRASQPIFLGILCAGTFMMSCSIIPTTFQEPLPRRLLDVGCMLDKYLFSVGFSTTFAALFSKTWRINIVLANAKKFRRVTIRPRDVLLPFAVLVVSNMAILVTWTIVAPLKWERIIDAEDEFGQPMASSGTCLRSVNNRDIAETTFLCLLLAVNVTALLFSNYQSYRARALPSEFNETWYVATSNLVILEGMVIAAPILFLVGDDPASFVLIQSLLVSIICLAVLVPMFVPKFNGTKDEKAKRHVRMSVFSMSRVSVSGKKTDANAWRAYEGGPPSTSGGGNVGNSRNVTSSTWGATGTVESNAAAS
jgi:ABC-type branched-subunit amino acid transport system substrate-binding protein